MYLLSVDTWTAKNTESRKFNLVLHATPSGSYPSVRAVNFVGREGRSVTGRLARGRKTVHTKHTIDL